MSHHQSTKPARFFTAILTGAMISSASAAISHADSKLVDARDPNRILEIARGYGTANPDVAADDTPMIIGRMDGTRYNIFFYYCDGENENCKSIQFYAGWTDIDMSLKALNEWNESKRWF
jgi:hypothetical protein